MRLFTRVAALVLKRIVTTRARIDLLPDRAVARQACVAVRSVTGATWLDHADALIADMRIQPFAAFCDTSAINRDDRAQCKAWVSK